MRRDGHKGQRSEVGDQRSDDRRQITEDSESLLDFRLEIAGWRRALRQAQGKLDKRSSETGNTASRRQPAVGSKRSEIRRQMTEDGRQQVYWESGELLHLKTNSLID